MVDLTSLLAPQCQLTLRRSLMYSKDIHLIRKQFTKIYYYLSKYRRIRNSLSPPRQYQQQGSSEINLRHSNRYSQSHVPQDSLSTGRSSAPIEMNDSRRPVLQPSARTPSDFSMSINYQSFNTPPSPVYQYVDLYDRSPENRWTTQ